MTPTRIGPVESYFLSFNLYAFGNGLVGVFLNLFFLSNYSFLAVLYFQIATFSAAMGSYLLATYFLPRWQPRHLYVLGLAFSAFVLFDLVTAGGVSSSALVFGVLWGTATGIFYAGNNPMIHDLTRGSDRTPFIATNNLLNGVVTLIAPVSAGALIQFSTFSGVLRYAWDFAVTAVFFLLSAMVVLRMRGETARLAAPAAPRSLRLAGSEYTRFKLFFAASQLFVIPVGILLPIYVFQVTESYLVTGLFASYAILLSVAANVWFRRGFRRGGRFALYAVLGIVASSAVLLVRWDPPVDAFLFAGVYTVLSTPLNNLVLVDFMNLIDRNGDRDRASVWSNREYYLGVGRIAVLGTMIGLSTFLLRSPVALIVILPVLSLYAVSYLGVLRVGPATSGVVLRAPRTPAVFDRL